MAERDSTERARGRVLVLGATGYIGGRLVPELLRTGWDVRCLVRSIDRLPSAWAGDVDVHIGDLVDAVGLDGAFAGVDQVVYLVHQPESADGADQRCAANARDAAAAAGVERIIALTGIGDDDAERTTPRRTGATLAGDTVPVLELQVAIVLGAGSAPFEMLRSLTEVLPVMVAPRWVSETVVQPIAIADALAYLAAALDAPVVPGHDVVQIGGPDRVTLRDLIAAYADVAGLRARLVLPVPFSSQRSAVHWVHLLTPLPRELSRAIVGRLQHDMVVTDGGARRLSDHERLGTHAAIEAAIAAMDDLDIPTRWSGLTSQERAAQPRPWDPDWAGGTVYEDCRHAETGVSGEQFMRTVRGIGGERGWYGFGALWGVRGVVDQLVGGVGLRRGRRHPDEIDVGEALDFWRVDAREPDLFRLHAEMKVPGEAWLEWTVEDRPDPTDRPTRVVQRARFAPSGLWGRAYWWVLVPFHAVIFPIMLRRIVRDAEQTSTLAVAEMQARSGERAADDSVNSSR